MKRDMSEAMKAIRPAHLRSSVAIIKAAQLPTVTLLSPTMRRNNPPVMNRKPAAKTSPVAYPTLLTGIGALLEESRRSVVRAANCFMTATYWEIGRRIVEFEQGGKKRAEYGEDLLNQLAEDLTERHGRGFGWRNLASMKLFYLSYPEILQTPSAKLLGSGEIANLQTLSAKSSSPNSATLSRKSPADSLSLLQALAARFPLPWSHYVKLLTVKDETARSFYEEEALRGGWSVRQLDRQISSLFYERTLLSKNKATMLQKGTKTQPGDALTVDEALRDPFVLEFLNLKDEYSESDLEDALGHHLETFLLELGGDFTFVGRQRRLRIGGVWYRVDLIFFHRRLRCLVIIDLKLGPYTHADAGQMLLYCNYAREHWTHESENPPVGIILCSSADTALAHYTLDTLPTKVMAREYQLALPAAKKLEAELKVTRKRLEQKRNRR
jgi:predicted nuclease of restriction endonuclease-like (RecB) superfamily